MTVLRAVPSRLSRQAGPADGVVVRPCPESGAGQRAASRYAGVGPAAPAPGIRMSLFRDPVPPHCQPVEKLV